MASKEIGRWSVWFWRFDDTILIIPTITLRVDMPSEHRKPCITLGIDWIQFACSIDFNYKKAD